MHDGDTATVRLAGEMDIYTLPELAAEVACLGAAGCARLIFDLRELIFMDSSGLRFLLDRSAKARENGHSIALIAGPPPVQRVFELTGTMELLQFVEP